MEGVRHLGGAGGTMSRNLKDQGIGVILTGGTISSHLQDGVTGVSERDLSDPRIIFRSLVSGWPESENLTSEVVQPLWILSENLTPPDWLTIARSIRALAGNGIEHFIVLHGTDTAAYTLAALSFLLADLDITVVLTGSILPASEPGSDAPTNVRHAVAASMKLRAWVYLSFAGAQDARSWVHVGTRVRKLHTYGQAFYSINRAPVAQIDDRSIEVYGPAARTSRENTTVAMSVDERVALIRIHPGINFDALRASLVHAQTRAAVLELHASATAPDMGSPNSLPSFAEACERAGIIVVASTPEAPSSLEGEYETTVAMKNSGVIYIPTLMPETALVKLMCMLPLSENPTAIKELMLRAVAGEFD
jgi:L-asparaginase/Glu-tRNA(Gln) amidotransferase subunit D